MVLVQINQEDKCPACKQFKLEHNPGYDGDYSTAYDCKCLSCGATFVNVKKSQLKKIK